MNYEEYLIKYAIQNPQLLLQKIHKRLYTGSYENKSAIIKIVTDVQGLQQEVNALRYFKKITPHTVPEVFFYANNILIMEHIIPGITIQQKYGFDTLQDMEILCKSIEKIHISYSNTTETTFQTLDQLLDMAWINTQGISYEYSKKAQEYAQYLLNTTQQIVLLHGDLFHENVIYSDFYNQWIVIDPKGLLGDPVYDVVSALFSPLSELLQREDCKKIIEDRIFFIVKKLQFSEERIRKWLFVKSVLALMWALEDNEPQEWIELWRQLLLITKEIS